MHVPPDGSIPKELQCALTKDSLILDAVMLPCCQTNVSHKVVVPRLLDSSCCPICMQPDVTADMLQENKKLRDSVKAFIRSAKDKGITIRGLEAPLPTGKDKPAASDLQQEGKDEEVSASGNARGSPHLEESGDGAVGADGGARIVSGGDDEARGEGDGEGQIGVDDAKNRKKKKKRGERGGSGKMGDTRPMGPVGGGPMAGGPPGSMGVRPGGTYGRGVGSLANLGGSGGDRGRGPPPPTFDPRMMPPAMQQMMQAMQRAGFPEPPPHQTAVEARQACLRRRIPRLLAAEACQACQGRWLR